MEKVLEIATEVMEDVLGAMGTELTVNVFWGDENRTEGECVGGYIRFAVNGHPEGLRY